MGAGVCRCVRKEEQRGFLKGSERLEAGCLGELSFECTDHLYIVVLLECIHDSGVEG